MSRRKPSVRKEITVSEAQHVYNVPQNPLPPGSGVEQNASQSEANVTAETAGEETNFTQVHDYPAVVDIQTSEEHKAAEEAAVEERVKRATKAKGPKRMSEREMMQYSVLLGFVSQDQSVTETEIPMENVPEDIQASLYATGGERNLFQRNLATPVLRDGKIAAIKLTEVGLDLYGRQSRKAGGVLTAKQKRSTTAKGEPRQPGGRLAAKYDGLRIRKLVDTNPRKDRSHGSYSFDLYQDGMSFREYIAIKDYEQRITDVNTPFDGPKRVHFEWDMLHGFIGLYRENEPEFISQDDGTQVPNPNFWAYFFPRA